MKSGNRMQLNRSHVRCKLKSWKWKKLTFLYPSLSVTTMIKVSDGTLRSKIRYYLTNSCYGKVAEIFFGPFDRDRNLIWNKSTTCIYRFGTRKQKGDRVYVRCTRFPVEASLSQKERCRLPAFAYGSLLVAQQWTLTRISVHGPVRARYSIPFQSFLLWLYRRKHVSLSRFMASQSFPLLHVSLKQIPSAKLIGATSREHRDYHAHLLLSLIGIFILCQNCFSEINRCRL